MREVYKDYLLESQQRKIASGKWDVNVKISSGTQTNTFYSNDKIYYILEVEAALEAINLGKNLINKNLVGF